ncbi:MAG: hypothetical protein N4A41_05465 [Crocinitomicaceae bacterium]|nr:hypothetical protein [Crocinitomicaceae bacterium]
MKYTTFFLLPFLVLMGCKISVFDVNKSIRDREHKDFQRDFANYILNPIEIYGIRDTLFMVKHMTFQGNRDGLSQHISCKFEAKEDSTRYFINNLLYAYYTVNSANKGWEMMNEEYWNSDLLSVFEKSRKKTIRNNDKFKGCDKSEYSSAELDKATFCIAMVKWRELNILYSQKVKPGAEDTFIQYVQNNIEKIKVVYNKNYNADL